MKYFWPYPVPLTFWVLGGVLLVVALIPGVVEKLARIRGVWIGTAAVLLIGSLFLPSQNHIMGDGMSHLANVYRYLARTEPLDIILHQLVRLVTGDMLLSYRIISFVALGAYLWGAYLMSRFGDSPVSRAVIALCFLCVATLQFYFGYVESYTLRDLFILYFLYFAWKEINYRRVSYRPLLFFGLATLSHFSAAALLPALIYTFRKRLTVKVYVTAIAVVVLGFLVASSVGLGRVFVPLFTSSDNHYTLFSGQHLLDMVNLVILITPAFFLACFGRKSGPHLTLGLIALAGTALFTFLVDPKLGAFRDWDLLSIFAVPMAVIVAIRAPRKSWVAAILLALIAVRVLPWLYFNSEQQAQFVKDLVFDDVHYTEKYFQGNQLKSFGLLLERIGETELAYEVLGRRLEVVPTDDKTLRMMAPLTYQMGKFDESYAYYLKLNYLEPENPEYWVRAAYLGFVTRNVSRALQLVQDAPEAIRSRPDIQLIAAGLLSLAGKDADAVQLALRSGGVFWEGRLPYQIAQSCIVIGDLQNARVVASQAVAFEPTNGEYQKLLSEIKSRLESAEPAVTGAPEN